MLPSLVTVVHPPDAPAVDPAGQLALKSAIEGAPVNNWSFTTTIYVLLSPSLFIIIKAFTFTFTGKNLILLFNTIIKL